MIPIPPIVAITSASTLFFLLISSHFHHRECLVNYQKEMKYKCACPLCKKPLNRRELMEAPKIRTITELFKRMFHESSRVQSSATSSQQGIKKRKLNDFLATPQGNTPAPFTSAYIE